MTYLTYNRRSIPGDCKKMLFSWVRMTVISNAKTSIHLMTFDSKFVVSYYSSIKYLVSSKVALIENFNIWGGCCAKTKQSSYGSLETKNKQWGSCMLTTKCLMSTNYYNSGMTIQIRAFVQANFHYHPRPPPPQVP